MHIEKEKEEILRNLSQQNQFIKEHDKPSWRQKKTWKELKRNLGKEIQEIGNPVVMVRTETSERTGLIRSIWETLTQCMEESDERTRSQHLRPLQYQYGL